VRSPICSSRAAIYCAARWRNLSRSTTTGCRRHRCHANNDTVAPTPSLIAAISMPDTHSQLLVQSFPRSQRLSRFSKTLVVSTAESTTSPLARRMCALSIPTTHPTLSVTLTTGLSMLMLISLLRVKASTQIFRTASHPTSAVLKLGRIIVTRSSCAQRGSMTSILRADHAMVNA
jgi:hypothetical protein